MSSVQAQDDALVFPSQLAKELELFDARRHVYLGAPSVTLLCHMAAPRQKIEKMSPEAKFQQQCGELHGGGGGTAHVGCFTSF